SLGGAGSSPKGLLGFRDRSGAMGAAADAEWLRWVSKQFGNVAGKEKEISLEEFKSALQVKESFFAERFFALFDSDGSGSLSREELLGSLRRLLRGNSTEKLRFLFQVYDVDGFGFWDGYRDAATGCRATLGLILPQLPIPNPNPHSRFPSAASWLKPPSPSPAAHWLCCFSRESCRDQRAGLCCFSRESCRDQRAGLCCFSRESWRDQRAGLCCLGGWVAISALLLALGALGHRERGPALALARGCGQSLNLNCALLAVSAPRHRGDTGGRAPGRAGGSQVGSRGWHGRSVPVLSRAPSPGLARRDWPVALGEFLRRARPGGGGVAGTAPQTGLALLALLLAMLACSSPCVRRGGHFEIFYWSHLSYISVWFLLLLHGPHFWKWFLIPGSLFFLEKVLGWVWRRAGDVHILEAKLLPSKVTHLVIQRPKSFRFQPGDYVYLNVPAIAAYEWHPFSISSAPEQPETLWLHIRARGQWTTKLYEYFQQLESHGPEPNPPGRSQHWEQCFLDGPYGTPSRRIFSSEHAVLIGAGIGITPFASILQSIMFRYRRRKQSCPSCQFSWSEERRDEEMTLRKVDFIWITRDQQHLQWFLGLLAQLESEQAELEPGGNFLELHLYMTSALGKGDVKALGLQLALDLLAEQEKRDSISGLRSRTQPGRPDWAKVFGKVAAERRGKVQVFFCGSAGLAKVIHGHCRRFGFRFSKENF
ncbi:NOX5 oxidase, partial [Copsychus sechellarum]|nr:NOX5 oxidase [Copsychus sechellarum]